METIPPELLISRTHTAARPSALKTDSRIAHAYHTFKCTHTPFQGITTHRNVGHSFAVAAFLSCLQRSSRLAGLRNLCFQKVSLLFDCHASRKKHEQPKEAQSRILDYKTKECKHISKGLLSSCGLHSLNGSPGLPPVICPEGPSTPGHPRMTRHRFFRSSHRLNPEEPLLFAAASWLSDTSAFLQDQLWHPLVDAPALPAVDAHLLQPAEVGLGVLHATGSNVRCM